VKLHVENVQKLTLFILNKYLHCTLEVCSGAVG
jgi:hypothetical protein